MSRREQKCWSWISRTLKLGMTTLAKASSNLTDRSSCSCEKREADSCGWGQFGNPDEGDRPLLEAATKQLLVKTEKNLCVL
jgi:hypothetical protein